MKTGVHRSPQGLCPQQEKLRVDWAWGGEAASAAHNSETQGGDLRTTPLFHVQAPVSDLSVVA